MNSPLADIGVELRQARESQQRSIDDLSQATLIHVRHLLALEDGREADLPEAFYVKNFIRKYANALGLEGDVMANRYWDTRPLPPHPPKPAASPDFMVPWWVFPAMLGALLLGAIGTFAVMNSNRAQAPAAPAATAAAATGSAGAEVAAATGSSGTEVGPDLAAGSAAGEGSVSADATAMTAVATATGAASSPPVQVAQASVAVAAAPAPEPTGTPGPINLPPLVVPGHRIKFQTFNKESAWMQIVADGREIHSGVVPRGSAHTWTASRSLAVRVGRPSVVTARLGDRPLGALGPKDAPVFRRTFLTREGELALGQARAGHQTAARSTPLPRRTSPPPAAEAPATPVAGFGEGDTPPPPAEGASESEVSN